MAHRALPLLFTLLLAPLALAADSKPVIGATLLADTSAAAPGEEFTLGVLLKIPAPWHVYWVNPGETGQATALTAHGPADWSFAAPLWPIPAKLNSEMGLSYAYEKEVLILLPVRVPKSAREGSIEKLSVDVDWMACHDTCIVGKSKVSIDIPVGQPKLANAELFDLWKSRLPKSPGKETAILAEVKQLTSPAGAQLPAIEVRWNQAPAKVDWYPISTPAVLIENVTVKHDGKQTRIDYKPSLYKADDIPDNTVHGVLIYEDAQGTRVGVQTAVKLPKP